MVMSTRVSGSTTKLKEEELTSTWMAPNTLVTGKRIDNMAMESKHGQIKPNTKAITSMEKSTALELLSGLTLHLTSENSTIITFMAKVSILGPIIGGTKENGARIKCMEKELLLGSMAENMSVSTLMIKRKATVNLCGLMADATGVSGKTENSMAKGPMLLQLAKKNMASGKMEKELDGSVEVNKIDYNDF